MNNRLNEVESYIKGRRTISFTNICTKFNIENKTLIPIIENLENRNLIRLVNSKCSLDCSSCTTCGEKPESKYLDTTIVVSLHLSDNG